MTKSKSPVRITPVLAGIAHLVERHLAKVEVASSSLVARSRLRRTSGFGCPSFLRGSRRTCCLHRNARSAFSMRGPVGFPRMAEGRSWDAGKRVRASLPAPAPKKPWGDEKAAGPFSCAGRAFSSRSHRDCRAGSRREPKKDGELPITAIHHLFLPVCNTMESPSHSAAFLSAQLCIRPSAAGSSPPQGRSAAGLSAAPEPP